MKIHYYPDTDSLYIHLSNRPAKYQKEIAGDFVVDFGEDGSPVGLDIQLASKKVDLSQFEMLCFPVIEMVKEKQSLS